MTGKKFLLNKEIKLVVEEDFTQEVWEAADNNSIAIFRNKRLLGVPFENINFSKD